MNVAAAILSFMCSFTFFQSCYSLKCYSCNLNVSQPQCNNIVDDKFLIECNSGDSCGQISKDKDGKTEISRSCISDDLLKIFNKEIKTMEKSGLKFNFAQICNTDRCNGKFQLNSLSF